MEKQLYTSIVDFPASHVWVMGTTTFLWLPPDHPGDSTTGFVDICGQMLGVTPTKKCGTRPIILCKYRGDRMGYVSDSTIYVVFFPKHGVSIDS